jgi:hypothetical protein
MRRASLANSVSSTMNAATSVGITRLQDVNDLDDQTFC